jgi:hypothetical protein
LTIPQQSDEPVDWTSHVLAVTEAAALDPYAGLVTPEPEEDVPGTFLGNEEQLPEAVFPVPTPLGSGTGNRNAPPLYGDVAALLDGGLPEPPAPSVLFCSDGVALFYEGQVNHVFGDPESGKTWLCLAGVASVLATGGRAAVVDLDHNGMAATVTRLLHLGAPKDALRDVGRFRYAEPEDRLHLLAIVADLREWRPVVVVVDSLGELLPLFGASSNSPDDFTKVNGGTLVPLARAGAAVVVIDHLAKNTDSRAMGATGTAAKKRAIGGVSLRVVVVDQFAPGQGGSARVSIAKDRHGGLRQHRHATGNGEPVAAMFRLYAEGPEPYGVYAPTGDERAPSDLQAEVDAGTLCDLDPPPTSVRDVAERMHWGKTRATAAMRVWRALTPDGESAA